MHSPEYDSKSDNLVPRISGPIELVMASISLKPSSIDRWSPSSNMVSSLLKGEFADDVSGYGGGLLQQMRRVTR